MKSLKYIGALALSALTSCGGQDSHYFLKAIENFPKANGYDIILEGRERDDGFI